MRITNKKIFTIIIVGILSGIGLGIYVYNELSHMTHIVPIYLTVDKREVEMSENVTIFVKIGTTKYPFELSNENTQSGGIKICRIPDNISPQKILSNKTLREEIAHTQESACSGHVPFVINNKKKVFRFVWNCTYPDNYQALAGYYFVYIDSYAISYGEIEPKFIINESSIFYLKGISAKIEGSNLIINSTEPLEFQGRIELIYSNSTINYRKSIDFNYSGRSFSLDLAKENIEASKVYVILITPYGRYRVGDYVHSGGK